MATIPSPPRSLGAGADIEYPTGDGRPVGETPIHFSNLKVAVEVLERFFADEPLVYSWGNMFVYYEKGNRHKHVSPDVFVAVGVPKDKKRDAYFTWEEGHGLDFVVELTSKSTQGEDLDDKMSIYQDEIVVPEYFLFDPKGEYLDPSLQGHRLREGKYAPIEMVDGRLPSEVLGLQLERDGEWLRFYNPVTGRWLPTNDELLHQERFERERAEEQRRRAKKQRDHAEQQRDHAEQQRERAEQQREHAEQQREHAEQQREHAEQQREHAEQQRERLARELEGSSLEIERLRRELDDLRRRSGDSAS